MRSLIIGRGEIGCAVREVIADHDQVDIYDITDGDFDFTETEILHICFPYTKDFAKEVQAYMKVVKPWHVIIWSTVPVGTTRQIKGAVHSPVEGRHPNLGQSVKDMVRWIGANDYGEGLFFGEYFKSMYMAIRLVDESDYTEALKLLSTTEYGVNIEFARYKKRVTDVLKMDFNLTKLWNRDYNKLYRNLGQSEKFQKFVLDAPVGPKGGHCITPNARLLYEQFPDELVKIVGELK